MFYELKQHGCDADDVITLRMRRFDAFFRRSFTKCVAKLHEQAYFLFLPVYVPSGKPPNLFTSTDI